MRTHKKYTAFDRSLARPLHGYVTELKRGTVPDWVLAPIVSKQTVQSLSAVTTGDYDNGIPVAELPEGIERCTRPPAPHDYQISRNTYLSLHQEQIRSVTDPSPFQTVRFALDPENNLYTDDDRDAVPSTIVARLNAVQNTNAWQDTVEDAHVDFKKWDLTYELGPRGGIHDVSIQADLL